MIANGEANTGAGSTIAPGRNQRSQKPLVQTLKSLPSRIRLVHVVVAIGVASVFIAYVSVAPPTDLPNWPLYRLNSRVWQTFEHWGQHVKPHHVRIITMALQHIESRALYILSYFEIPDIINKAGEPLSCHEIKSRVDKKFGSEPVNLPFLCRVLHAAAHFDLLREAGEDKYSLTSLSEYLVSSHPRSLKEFVKLYSGDEALIVSTALSRSMFSGLSGFKETFREELAEYLPKDEQLREVRCHTCMAFLSTPIVQCDTQMLCASCSTTIHTVKLFLCKIHKSCCFIGWINYFPNHCISSLF